MLIAESLKMLSCCNRFIVLLAALHVFDAPQWCIQAMLMARLLIRNTVDTYLDWYLGTKLDLLMNEHRVVHIIHLLQGLHCLSSFLFSRPVWAKGNPFSSYSFTSPPSTPSFSIFYFSLCLFLTRFIYFLAFPSFPILLE